MSLRADEAGIDYLGGAYGNKYGWGITQISYLELATDFLKVFNMSSTMARQGGWVQLEQSNMRLALYMSDLAKGGFSRATIEEMQYLIDNHDRKVWE